MNRQDAEEYTKSLTQVFRGGWELIEWAEGQGIPQALGLTTREWVRTRLGGYVQLPVEERRKAVKTLTNKGKSTRQIGGILGVDFSTVSRDLSVANATKTSSKEPQSVANATDKQEPKSASNGTDKPPTEEQINKRTAMRSKRSHKLVSDKNRYLMDIRSGLNRVLEECGEVNQTNPHGLKLIK